MNVRLKQISSNEYITVRNDEEENKSLDDYKDNVKEIIEDVEENSKDYDEVVYKALGKKPRNVEVTKEAARHYNLSNTGNEKYNKYLENIGEDVYLTMMSPREYIDRCCYIKYKDMTPKEVVMKRLTDKDKVAQYSNLMNNGEKFMLPVLDIKGKEQDGIHRAIASMILKDKMIPVLVIV